MRDISTFKWFRPSTTVTDIETAGTFYMLLYMTIPTLGI